MALLRPMQGSAQSALVALRSSTKLFAYEIKVSIEGVLSSSITYLLRAFHVGKDGNIERVSQLGSSDISSYNSIMTGFGSLASWNYSSSSPTLWASKTLSGLVDCEFSTDSHSCKAPATAKGSWSTIEVTATGSCRAYDLCKTQDTFYVHSYAKDSDEFSYRLPVRVLSTEGASLELGSWHRWAYMAAYPLEAVDATIDGVLKSGESPALSFARSATGSYSLTPLAMGMDTLQLSLAGTPFKVPMHVALPADLIDGVIPATPGIDTVYGLTNGMYLKLPAASAFSMRQVPQGVLIEGMNGDYGVQVLDAQDKRLHTLQGHSTGSLLVPLQGTGLRIVQLYNQGQSRHLKIVR